MAVVLKRLMGEGGAGLDSSNGLDNLWAVLNALVAAHQAEVTQFNQLLADVIAHPVATTAAALTSKVTAE